jgi:hypothetical protein
VDLQLPSLPAPEGNTQHCILPYVNSPERRKAVEPAPVAFEDDAAKEKKGERMEGNEGRKEGRTDKRK